MDGKQEMSETKRELPPILLVLLGSVITGVVIFIGIMSYHQWYLNRVVQADVCAAVVEIYPEHFIYLEVVRGYNEYWDQHIGTDILVKNENLDLEVDDRLTLTARTLWGKWDIDWDTPYEDCPEAVSGTGN